MNELTILQHRDFGRIRAEVRNGEPWFVAKDICDALGIQFHRDAISRLDDDERGSVLLDTLGGRQQLTAVNESGLYNLIFQSRKLQAKSFKKWVTSEVLPSIRRTGKYEAQPKQDADYVDLRGVPYERREMNGRPVRVIRYIGDEWYSVNDVHAAMGVRTGSGQAARQLNAAGRTLAMKILITGNTHPAWFASGTGVKLMEAGSRGMRRPVSIQLTIENFR